VRYGLLRGGPEASVVLREGKAGCAGLWRFTRFHVGRHRWKCVVLRAMGVVGCQV